MALLTPNGYGLGWIPSVPDIRDHIYSAPRAADLPPEIDLRSVSPEPPFDQLQTSSCVGNGVAFAIGFAMAKQLETYTRPSRLFAYYGARDMEGIASSDSGCQIRDAIKFVATTGVCPETEWPFDTTKVTTKPTDQCYTDAPQHLAIQYQSVPQDLLQMQSVLASGFPIIGGLTLYQSFESVGSDGMVPMPSPTEQILGGHCLSVIGISMSRKVFIVRNSWNTTWGSNGYCYIPFDYWLNPNLADDLWTVKLVK